MSITSVKIKSALASSEAVTNVLQISAFALLTVFAAQISIPVKPVPFTLQSVIVVLAGLLLGAKKGAMSQILYLGLGIVGLPVFAMSADATLGIARLFGPTGGYLLAFPLAAFVTGLIVEKYKGNIASMTAMAAGNLIILLSGVLFLNTFFIKNTEQAFLLGAGVFSVWSIAKLALTFTVYKAIKK